MYLRIKLWCYKGKGGGHRQSVRNGNQVVAESVLVCSYVGRAAQQRRAGPGAAGRQQFLQHAVSTLLTRPTATPQGLTQRALYGAIGPELKAAVEEFAEDLAITQAICLDRHPWKSSGGGREMAGRGLRRPRARASTARCGRNESQAVRGVPSLGVPAN